MPNILDRDYLFKSAVELVREENSRIVSSGLATKDEVQSFMQNIVSPIVIKAATEFDKDVVDIVAGLHTVLASVKLPGDFGQLTKEVGDKLCIVLDLPIKENLALFIPETKEEGVKEEKSVEVKEEDLDAENEDEEIIELKSSLITQLEKIAYMLGGRGDHNAAYIVEKYINYINCK